MSSGKPTCLTTFRAILHPTTACLCILGLHVPLLQDWSAYHVCSSWVPVLLALQLAGSSPLICAYKSDMPACTPCVSLGLRGRAGRALKHENKGRCKHSPLSGKLCLTERRKVAASATNGENSSSPSLFTAVAAVAVKVYRFVDAQFLPVALISALTVGYFQPAAAVAAKEAGIGKAATLVIFILSGVFFTFLCAVISESSHTRRLQRVMWVIYTC